MTFENTHLDDLSSLADIDLLAGSSDFALEEFESQMKIFNEQYLKDFETQMLEHQMTIDEMNESNKRFIDSSMNLLKLSSKD